SGRGTLCAMSRKPTTFSYSWYGWIIIRIQLRKEAYLRKQLSKSGKKNVDKFYNGKLKNNNVDTIVDKTNE
ncbi:hypothetical protein PIROE2DRAFT_1911, partial [Piromyces sp. E2]